METFSAPPVRLAELVALLSLGTDLGFAQPMEHVVRQCLIALKLGDHLGMEGPERRVLYYSALLAWVGCHTDAYEQAKWFGDDIWIRRDTAYQYDRSRPTHLVGFLLRYFGGADRPLLVRARVGADFLAHGVRDFSKMYENHYLAADGLAVRLGLGEDVRESLSQSFERWDGKGLFGLRGDHATLASRVVNLADVVEVFQRVGGIDAATAIARERSGTQFDPRLVELFCDTARPLFDELGPDFGWNDVIAAEPLLDQPIDPAQLEDALEAIAEFADLKSPFTIGHSRGVAELCGLAGADFLPADQVSLVRRSALVHDLGRLGVSNAIWDKRGAVTRPERERIQLHPYLSHRMLAHSPGLAPLGEIAVQHHERLDGSGYPHGLKGAAITAPGRVLAVADRYRTLIEERPHRARLTEEEAAKALRDEVTAGLLDGDAVRAVLRAAGFVTERRREWPAGLTAREVEILRLVCRGLSTKEVAERLVISNKTAANHIHHIYEKAGVSNRAQASLFAVRNGLMD